MEEFRAKATENVASRLIADVQDAKGPALSGRCAFFQKLRNNRSSRLQARGFCQTLGTGFASRHEVRSKSSKRRPRKASGSWKSRTPRAERPEGFVFQQFHVLIAMWGDVNMDSIATMSGRTLETLT